MIELPEIHFAPETQEQLEATCMTIIKTYLGRKISRADPVFILMRALLAIIIQQRSLIDKTARQNLLAYAEGVALDHLGVLVGTERLPASKAVTTMQVTLSAPRQQSTIIRKGTRVTADNQIFFALDDDVLFSAGETVKTCAATCLETGAAGNGYAAGEVDRIVDNQAFLKKIENVTTTEGGADTESDESFRERIQMSPEAYSCAGSEGAYIFHAKSTSALISGVAIHSPQPGYVDVYILLHNGQLPGQEMLNAVYKQLNANKVRPLTDHVTVKAPTRTNYILDLTCYISRDDSVNAAQIQRRAEEAISDYIAWQQAALGRDINPDELIFRLKKAGIKRAVIRSPSFTVLDKFSVAIANSVSKNFVYDEEP